MRLWPTTALYSIGFINALLYGGPRFLSIGAALGIAGLVFTTLVLSVDPHYDTEPLGIALSIAGIFCYITLVGTTAYRLRLRQRETRAALEREESRSQQLLSNVFPELVIPRLRAGESPIADQFADVTVIFADIVEFTPLAERIGPRRTVVLLNELFARFDQAAQRLGVEKIETTGDGYLAVAGAPQPLDRHAEAAARFALAAIDAARKAESEPVRIRVGIHTGPVYGGVVGESRFHYKLFGDTVNIASRVQSPSQEGRVLVSEATQKRLQGEFALEERGILDLKGHGPMRCYWLLELRP
jgi:class 3 adenylate cyclase